MAMRILWPNLPAWLVPVATEAVGSGFELEFREKFEDVSDEQWANADGVVGGCPRQQREGRFRIGDGGERRVLTTDYLIIGSGAFGMAFADQLLTETDADMAIVDRHHMPGGHWNDAYSFVRLHQPSAFYGVGSRSLGSNRIDESGFNRGYYELASGAEVTSYFEQVMKERFLPFG